MVITAVCACESRLEGNEAVKTDIRGATNGQFEGLAWISSDTENSVERIGTLRALHVRS